MYRISFNIWVYVWWCLYNLRKFICVIMYITCTAELDARPCATSCTAQIFKIFQFFLRPHSLCYIVDGVQAANMSGIPPVYLRIASTVCSLGVLAGNYQWLLMLPHQALIPMLLSTSDCSGCVFFLVVWTRDNGEGTNMLLDIAATWSPREDLYKVLGLSKSDNYLFIRANDW